MNGRLLLWLNRVLMVAAISVDDLDFVPLLDAAGQRVDPSPVGHGLTHLTHKVFRGRMKEWAALYERFFNVREVRATSTSRAISRPWPSARPASIEPSA